MLSQSPLEIPEVTTLVASYLTGGDLASCVRVSKNWRDCFLPHRWRDVTRSNKWSVDSYKHFGPSQEALHNHRHLVRKLSINGRFREDETYTHPNLRHLRIDFSRHSDVYYHNDRGAFDWDLSVKSPLLESLSLSYIEIEPRSCQGISKLPHLRSLKLWKVKIKDVFVPGFWEACKNLESLSMDNVRFEGIFVPIPTDTVFAQLRTLSMKDIRELPVSAQLAIAFHSPVLRSFEWEAISIEVRILIKHPVQEDLRPQLRSLSIPDEPLDAEWASTIKTIGDCLGNLTYLHLQSGTFGSKAFKALGSHCSSLVDLDLSYATSPAIKDVLCSCPMLEKLRVTDVSVKHIIEGGPWVCQQLRELSISFRVKESERNLQSLVFERLSTLVRLTKLDMNNVDEESSIGVLEFRSHYGLGQLASLQELRAIGFYWGDDFDKRQQLRRTEVEWMIHNWKNLKGIYGLLNDDDEVHDEYMDLLSHHGILVGEDMVLDSRLASWLGFECNKDLDPL
ncbi:hypothetical protein BGX34_000578 [Mortierella sp. NVP85]|nr:hypothetical protein BGX34_000578 [Mortierella sp. NVP85]